MIDPKNIKISADADEWVREVLDKAGESLGERGETAKANAFIYTFSLWLQVAARLAICCDVAKRPALLDTMVEQTKEVFARTIQWERMVNENEPA